MDNVKVPKSYVPIMFLLGILLFLEWIYPTKELANTTNLSAFILFTLVCMFLTIVSIPSWFANSLKGLGILFIIHSLFMKEAFLSLEWARQLFGELYLNAKLLMQLNLIELTPMFRTILFLVLIWLMVYLIHYWFIQVRRFFLFILLTIVYLSVIDSFTTYDASWAMIRSFGFSFLALGYANWFKQTVDQSVGVDKRKGYYSWKLPIFLIIFIISVFGFFLPKHSAKWPDPIPFIKSMSDHTPFFSGGEGNKEVGLGEDDSKLGGSFAKTEEVVFEAFSGGHSYWRVDAKDFYTGKGWVDSGSRSFLPVTDGAVKLNFFSTDVERRARSAIVSFKDDDFFPKIPYPYEMVEIYTANKEADRFLSYDGNGAVEVPEDHRSDLQDYGIVYANPVFDVEVLRDIDVRSDSLDILGQQDYVRYTQLPVSLPDRVKDLAYEITEHFDKDYDKVKAIESHFHTSGFRYETEKVPYPGEEEDYVDQFLFDTKYGYCDNFSSSMVVMLRTLGFPSRWAKGYTAGEITERNVSYTAYEELLDMPEISLLINKYEVRNTNAHSWVEVFFPNIGWVPFEPTKGFANEADFISTDRDTEEILEAENPVEDLEEESPEIEEIEEEVTEKEVEPVEKETRSKIPLYIALGVLGLLLVTLFIFRVRLRILYYKYLLANKPSQENYERAYIYLLKLLEEKGMKKKTNETLREYAKKIDHRYKVMDMGELTAHYEELLYRKEKNINNYKISQLWENMIKHVIA